MRAMIHIGDSAITIEDDRVVIPSGSMPVGPALDGFAADAARPIDVIHFDGVIGTIQRISRAQGRFDFEHFVGAGPLKPYLEAHAAEKARLAEAKRVRDGADDARTAEHQAAIDQAAKS